MKGARKTKRGVCAGGKGASKSTFAANCQQRAECSRAPCPLPWLVWEGGGGWARGGTRNEHGEQRPGEDSRAPVRQVIIRQVNKTACMYVLEIESGSSPVE